MGLQDHEYAIVRSLDLGSQGLFRTQYLETAGVLYDAYKMRAFWWEPVTLSRRLIIASVYTGLFNIADWRSFAMFLVVTAGFVLHILFYPYRQRVENFVEAYLLLLLMVVASLMASSAVYLFGVHKSLLLGLIIALSVIAIIILALWNFMLLGAQKLAEKWENERFKQWVEWTNLKLREKKVNQPRSLSKFYSWQEKRDGAYNLSCVTATHFTAFVFLATWAKDTEMPAVELALGEPSAMSSMPSLDVGDEDRPYFRADL